MEPGADEALMERVQAGDEEAFALLYRRYRTPLYGYLRRMVPRGELADEILQDSFLNAYRARDDWRTHRGSFRSWLYRIATNLVRDRARGAGRRPEAGVEDVGTFGGGGADPLSRLSLERALDGLPEPLREAFWLGAVDGLDHREVALALSISPDNARARISRARQHLRAALNGVPAGRPEGKGEA